MIKTVISKNQANRMAEIGLQVCFLRLIFRPHANIVIALEEIITELRKREAQNLSLLSHLRDKEQGSKQRQRNNAPAETIAEEMLRRLPELQAATDRLIEKVGLYKKATGGAINVHPKRRPLQQRKLGSRPLQYLMPLIMRTPAR
jgi:hypothetical protein